MPTLLIQGDANVQDFRGKIQLELAITLFLGLLCSSTIPVQSQKLLPTIINVDIRSQLATLSIATVHGCAGKVTAAQTIYDQILRAKKHNECINYLKLFLRCSLEIKIRKGNSESGLLQQCSFLFLDKNSHWNYVLDFL